MGEGGESFEGECLVGDGCNGGDDVVFGGGGVGVEGVGVDAVVEEADVVGVCAVGGFVFCEG